MKTNSLTWSKARSLADLGEITARWLLGLVPNHPCQEGPPDLETNKIKRALIRLNRSGWVTDFSQPAEPHHNGCAQRACVSGFCDERLARTIATLMLCAELMALAFPPNGGGGYRIPITIDDYHPFIWHALFDPQYVFNSFAGTFHHEALRALRRAWYIIVIDPVWGRQRYLWQQIEKVMRQGAAARRHDGVRRRLSARPLPLARRLRLQRDARLRTHLPDADADHAGRHAGAPVRGLHGGRGAGAEGRSDEVSLEGAEGPDPPSGATRARLPPGASTRDSRPLRRAVRRRSTAPPFPPCWRAGDLTPPMGIENETRIIPATPPESARTH
jgi:hypothetical protein